MVTPRPLDDVYRTWIDVNKHVIHVGELLVKTEPLHVTDDPSGTHDTLVRGRISGHGRDCLCVSGAWFETGSWTSTCNYEALRAGLFHDYQPRLATYPDLRHAVACLADLSDTDRAMLRHNINAAFAHGHGHHFRDLDPSQTLNPRAFTAFKALCLTDIDRPDSSAFRTLKLVWGMLEAGHRDIRLISAAAFDRSMTAESALARFPIQTKDSPETHGYVASVEFLAAFTDTSNGSRP